MTSLLLKEAFQGEGPRSAHVRTRKLAGLDRTLANEMG